MSPTTKSKKESGIVKYYLIAYNAVSAAAWAYLLVLLVQHFVKPATVATAPSTAAERAFGWLTVLQGYISTKTSSAVPSTLEPHVRQLLTWTQPYIARASTLYAAIGEPTVWVQTAAILEVVHVLIGWVRAPLATTAMQVASRLSIVWLIVEQYPVTRTNPFYASMVTVWSLSEIIRYNFYIFSLLTSLKITKEIPFPLVWIRYTAFYILYPIGAFSEAALIYQTLPSSSPIPNWKSWINGIWTFVDYFHAFMLLIWFPSLVLLYTYMIQQRRKTLGGSVGRKLGSKPKSKVA